jgi:hypothetical protein
MGTRPATVAAGAVATIVVVAERVYIGNVVWESSGPPTEREMEEMEEMEEEDTVAETVMGATLPSPVVLRTIAADDERCAEVRRSRERERESDASAWIKKKESWDKRIKERAMEFKE